MSTSMTLQDNEEPLYYENLDAALDMGLKALARGADSRRATFHTITVATIREDGAPSLRTVVLRSFDKDLRLLTFHTDIRSSKFKEITQDSRVMVHIYDPKLKLQIRLECEAKLHWRDKVAEQAWARSQPTSRECYKQAHPPGTILATPEDGQVRTSDDNMAYENFGVVCAHIIKMEWLYLAAKGHRRAEFSWKEGSKDQCWLAP